MKYWVILLLLIGFVGCDREISRSEKPFCLKGCDIPGPGGKQGDSDELVVRPAVTIKNPTPLQRACKDYIYQTPPTFPVPVADSVLNGYELSLCVSLLAGEDPNQKNDQGESLLQIANKITDSNKQARIVEILRAAGSK